VSGEVLVDGGELPGEAHPSALRVCLCYDVGPSTRAAPESGRSKVASIRMTVVLPAPLGPSRLYTTPVSTARSTMSTARVSPKALTRSDVSIAKSAREFSASPSSCGVA
jgi:hypothetical protein